MVASVETAMIIPDKVTEQELNRTVTEIEAKAETFTIQTDEDYRSAAAFGRLLRQRTAEVKSFWRPLKEAANKAHSEICSKEKAMLKPLESAEKVLKAAMGEYVAEQKRIRKEAEEAARQAAQEEVERKMREAIELEARGDSIGAEIAIEEAEIMDDAKSSISVPSTNPKAAGVSSTKDWEIINIDDRDVPVAFEGTVIRPVDTAAVMRLIRASKGTIRIPGVSYREVAKIAFRK